MTTHAIDAVESGRIDIEAEVRSLCEKFGIERLATAEIEMRIGPDAVKVTIYERNEHGKFFVDPDKRGVATRTLNFRVTT